MTQQTSVECEAQGLRSLYKYEPIFFNTGTDLNLALEGETGPEGIHPISADLLDFAAAIYQIERQLKIKPTSPPQRMSLRMQVRKPKAWKDEAISAAQDILNLLGNAEWDIKLRGGLKAPAPDHSRNKRRAVKQVALLSGGMDSACGLATLKHDAAATQLVSFYTRQKSLQRDIASALGYTDLSQWRMRWVKGAGPGHSFLYRSFLFLCLAAVIAESWGARAIIQFENGVLATAIPPGTAWLMTKHAHPFLHKAAVRLFSALLGGEWKISNPFLPLTKRDCAQEAAKAIGKAKCRELLEMTETCWFHWSNRVIGGSKPPGKPCGICIPCIVRRTAMPGENYAYDLLDDNVKEDPRQGQNFRSYYLLLSRILKTRRSPGEFYALLPPIGRELVNSDSSLSLNDLHQLFLRFGKEFMKTFNMGVPEQT